MKSHAVRSRLLLGSLALLVLCTPLFACGGRTGSRVRIVVRDPRGMMFTGAVVEWAGGFAPITDGALGLPPGVAEATIWGGGCRPVRLERVPGHVVIGMTPGPLLRIEAPGAAHAASRDRRLQLVITRVGDDVDPPRDVPIAVPTGHLWTNDGWRPQEIFVDPETETVLVHVMAPGTYRVHWQLWRGTVVREPGRYQVSGVSAGPRAATGTTFTVEDRPGEQVLRYPVTAEAIDRWLPPKDD